MLSLPITVIYGSLVVDTCLLKTAIHITRLTVGGYQIKYKGDISNPTPDIATDKILFNDIVSNFDSF